MKKVRRKVLFTALGWWNGKAQTKRRGHSNRNRNKQRRQAKLATRVYERDRRKRAREVA